ncbi:MAG: hypothetical protein LBF88_13005 [Planctomycetaceae bacterium]|jgi:hypothetical protein|nr:hypothetical protein [Planctomycetaceae bacterium]
MNHIHISINGKTIIDDVQSTSFTKKTKNDNDDVLYYDDLFDEVYPIKKSCWSYKIYKAVIIGSIATAIICLLPYFLFFIIVIVGIIAKLFGF